MTATAANAGGQGAYATANAGDSAATTGQEMAGEAGGDRAGLVMQSTGLNAGTSSIYSNGTRAVATSNAYAAQTGGANATVNSLYAGGNATQDAGQTGRLPVEDMPQVDLSAQQPLETLGDEQVVVLPENVPIPKTARMALVNEAASGNAADLALATQPEGDLAIALPETANQATIGKTQAKDGQRKAVTLASSSAASAMQKRSSMANAFPSSRAA